MIREHDSKNSDAQSVSEPSSVYGDAIFHDDAGGEVVDTFYSLIQPEPNYYAWFCQRVHGLGPEDTDNAEVFPYVWEKIASRIEGP
mgnify:CR=1 FL=1